MAYFSLGQGPTVISHNIKGLKVPEKRTTTLRELKKGRLNFAFLQETHFKTNQIPKRTNSFFTEAYYATNGCTKSKEVSILVSKDAPFTLTDRLTNPEGRYIFLKGTYAGTPLNPANVYFPNSAHITFCQRIIRVLQGFMTGCLILEGDFNNPLNPLVDTSSGKTCITYKIPKRVKALLHSVQVFDTWRFLHPNEQDFTFHSIPHNRYSRIDYLFISQ